MCVLRLAWLAAFFVFVFVGGALIAPWVWWGLQAVAQSSSAEWVQGLARHPFHRIVHRCLLILALIGMIPLARSLGIRGWREIGVVPDRRSPSLWLRGMALGLAMFSVILVIEFVLEIRVIRSDRDWARLPWGVAGALLTGLVVGVIEEILFRGVLCGGLRRVLGWGAALAISSLIYAAVHFFERPPAPQSVEWNTGLEMVGRMLAGMASPDRWLPGMVTLFVAGWMLGEGYRRTDSLYFPMGLHTGWVFLIKIRGWVTAPRATLAGEVPSGIASEWLRLGIVLVTALILAAWLAGWMRRGRR